MAVDICLQLADEIEPAWRQYVRSYLSGRDGEEVATVSLLRQFAEGSTLLRGKPEKEVAPVVWELIERSRSFIDEELSRAMIPAGSFRCRIWSLSCLLLDPERQPSPYVTSQSSLTVLLTLMSSPFIRRAAQGFVVRKPGMLAYRCQRPCYGEPPFPSQLDRETCSLIFGELKRDIAEFRQAMQTLILEESSGYLDAYEEAYLVESCIDCIARRFFLSEYQMSRERQLLVDSLPLIRSCIIQHPDDLMARTDTFRQHYNPADEFFREEMVQSEREYLLSVMHKWSPLALDNICFAEGVLDTLLGVGRNNRLEVFRLMPFLDEAFRSYEQNGELETALMKIVPHLPSVPLLAFTEAEECLSMIFKLRLPATSEDEIGQNVRRLLAHLYKTDPKQ